MLKKRIEWIDISKCICMLSVIFSHLESSTSLFIDFINPYFLVVFFFCAGYCYKHKLVFKDFIYKKIRQLFVPWFVFSYANIFLSYILSFKEHIGIKDEIIRNALQIRGYDDKLWFIAAIFVAYVPFYFLIKSVSRNKTNSNRILIILLMLYIIRDIYYDFLPSSFFSWNNASLPWHIDYIPVAVFYMYLGYWFRDNFESVIDNYNNIFIRTILLIICFVLVYVVRIDSLLLLIFYKIVRHIICIIYIVMVSKKISPNKYMLFIGNNTLVYFSIHNKISTLLEAIISKLLLSNLYSCILNNELVSNIFGIVLTVIISLVLIIPTQLINKYFPKLLGREL